MYGEDNRAVGAGQSVQVVEQFQGRSGVQAGGGLVEEDQTGHAQQLDGHAETALLSTTQARASRTTNLHAGKTSQTSLMKERQESYSSKRSRKLSKSDK